MFKLFIYNILYLYSGMAATVTKTIMCKPAVNADIKFSKNCRNW